MEVVVLVSLSLSLPHFLTSLLIFFWNLVSTFDDADMSSTAFIEPLPVIDFVTQLLNRDVSSRPLSDADRVKVSFCSIDSDDICG